MIFGPHLYMPILKAKRGEKKALLGISPSVQPQITPLLEIVARKSSKTLSAHLDNAFKDLAESVSPYSRCFLDAREIEADGEPGAADVFRRASEAGIIFTPVTGISRTADVVPAIQHKTHGLALRLTRAEFERGGLPTRLYDFLSQYRTTPEELDLIIDLGAVEDLIVEGIATFANAFLAEVPDHQLWRTFTVSACAFPRSMAGVDRDSHDFVERAEWVAWKDHLYERRHSLQRLPTFSDCAIQHPAGVEGFDPRLMQVSASIRYTLDGAWLLIKGKSTRFKRPGEQFPALADKLVYGGLQPNFAGLSHCNACALMKAAAEGAPGFGSAEIWRQLGTIHHISTVMQGLGSLPSS